MEQTADDPNAGPRSQSIRLIHRPRCLLLVGDALAVIIASVTAYMVMRLRSSTDPEAIVVTSVLAVLIGALTVALLAWSGEYTKRLRVSRISDTGFLTRDLVIALALANLLSYMTKGFFTGVTGPSRLALGSFVVLFWLLGVVTRFTVSIYQRRLFANGTGVRSIMVLGTGPEAERVIEFIRSRPWLGLSVSGRLTTADPLDTQHHLPAYSEGSAGEPSPQATLPLEHFSSSLEGLQRLDRTMRAAGADEIIVALEPDEREELVQVTSLLSLSRMPFTVVPSLFEETVMAGCGVEAGGVHFLDTAVDPPDRLVRAVKRSTDVFIAAFALLLLIPVGAPLALAIVLESGRPVFYKQERLGRYGQPFSIHKFRTMSQNAEARLQELESQDEGEGPHFKMKRDPRLTRVGAFLRKWSIDEMPQFWNVLRGDMSVVGPRPPLPREVAKYDTSQLVRLKGKPGITGLWQVSGRKNLSFEDMVRLDRYYIENWSLRLDLSIIFRTFSAVITRRGAY